MPILTIMVRATWDPDAAVWVATSDDVPGLVTEAASWAQLEGKLQQIIPDLLELNGCLSESSLSEVPMCIVSQQLSKVRLRS